MKSKKKKTQTDSFHQKQTNLLNFCIKLCFSRMNLTKINVIHLTFEFYHTQKKMEKEKLYAELV